MNVPIGLILILFCFLTSFLELHNKKNNKFLVFFIFVFFVLWMGTKDYNNVPDGEAYFKSYEAIQTNSSLFDVQDNISGFEPGYMFLSCLTKKIGFSHSGFLAILAVINQCIILIAGKLLFKNLNYKNSEIPYGFLLSLYCGYVGLFYNAIVLRAGVAISFMFLGYVLLINKQYLVSILVYFSAFLFHRSSLFFIFFTTLIHFVKIKKQITFRIWWLAILLLFLSNASYFFRILIEKAVSIIGGSGGVLAYFVLNYGKNFMSDGFASKKNLLYLGIGFILVFIKVEDKYKFIFYQFLKIYLSGLMLMFLLNSFPEGYRISDLFLISVVPSLVIGMKHSTTFSFDTKLVLVEPLVIMQFIIALRVIIAV